METGWIPKEGVWQGRTVKQGDKIQIGWLECTIVGVLDSMLFYTTGDGTQLWYARIHPSEKENT